MSAILGPIRRGLKAVVRPIFRPLLLRLEMPLRVLQPRLDIIDQAIAQIDAAIGRLDAAHGATVGRVQTLEGGAEHDRTLIAALRNENQNLVRGWLRMRTDMLRLEQTRQAGQGWVRISPTALAGLAQRVGPLRLHISTDGSRAKDSVNVSDREGRDADLIAAFGDLPFPPGSVDEITVSGSHEPLDPAWLAHWRSLLRPGGTISFGERSQETLALTGSEP